MKRKILISLLTVSTLSCVVGCSSKKTDQENLRTENNSELNSDSETNTEKESISVDDLFLHEKYKNYPEPETIPTVTIFGGHFTGAPVSIESIAQDAISISYDFHVLALDEEGHIDHEHCYDTEVTDAPGSELLSLQGYIGRHAEEEISIKFPDSEENFSQKIMVCNLSDETLPAATCLENGWWYIYGVAEDGGDMQDILGVSVDVFTQESWEILFDKFATLVGPADYAYRSNWGGETSELTPNDSYAYIMCFEIDGHIFELEVLQMGGVPTLNKAYYYPIEYHQERVNELQDDADKRGYEFKVLMSK